MNSEYVLKLAELVMLSGKCVLFIGAPGTGKTRSCIEISRRLTGIEPRIIVGRGDLSYEDLVYTYELRNQVPRVVLGELALSVLASWVRLVNNEAPVWFVIDEVNRFNVDLALGDLFIGLDLEHRRRAKVIPLDVLRALIESKDFVEALSAIVGLGVENVEKSLRLIEERFRGYGYVPIPYSWRALATMNVVDRSHLFRLGFAFLRRFAMILFPSALREFECELNASDIDAYDEVPEAAISEAYRELSLCSEDIGVPSDRALYSLTLSRKSVEDALRRFNSVVRVFNYFARKMDSVGIDIGYSTYVDLCRLLTVAYLTDYDDEAQLADLAISSILLPHVGSIAPKLRAELLVLGRTRRIDALSQLFSDVSRVLGSRSRSSYYCEVLSLEVPAATP